MNEEISPDQLIIEKLDDHDIDGFSCEIKDLTEFLCENSKNQMKINLSVTYVVIYKKQVVAYFTLSTDSLRFADIEEGDQILLKSKNVNYSNLPGLKLCRLAVHEDYQGNDIGPYIVKRIIRLAQNLSENLGLRFITVDAYLQSVDFYRNKFEFTLFPKKKYRRKMNKYYKYKDTEPERLDPDDTVPLYLDIYIE